MKGCDEAGDVGVSNYNFLRKPSVILWLVGKSWPFVGNSGELCTLLVNVFCTIIPD